MVVLSSETRELSVQSDSVLVILKRTCAATTSIFQADKLDKLKFILTRQNVIKFYVKESQDLERTF